MTGDSASNNFTNHFLIAMPGLNDEIFSKSVVYVCEHGPRGALGLVINKPGPISMAALFDKVNLPLMRHDLADCPVFQGGPVQVDRGFVLHESQQPLESDAQQPLYASTLSIPGGLDMTTSKDVLEALAKGHGPHRVLVSLGYSSWEQGQLESEMLGNAWISVNADSSIIFDTPVEQRYDRALALLGLESWMISTQVGHA
jgi:putative transcriptional regulator